MEAVVYLGHSPNAPAFSLDQGLSPREKAFFRGAGPKPSPWEKLFQSRGLSGSIQHVADEDAIPGSWIADHDMGDGTDEAAILDDGGAGQA